MNNHFIKKFGGYWNGFNFDAKREGALMMSKQLALATSTKQVGSSVYRIVGGKKAPSIDADGGLAASGIKDKNNCTVRALAIAANLSYEFADEIATKAGRIRGKGMQTFKLMQHASISGVKSINGGLIKKMSVKNFLHLHPQGRYVCRISKHAFAVIDGVVHDANRSIGERCKVTQYWEMTTYGMPIEMPKI